MRRGKIQMDDVYLGGERPGSNAGRGSENKIPIVAAVSLNEAGHPIHARISAVSGFSSEAIAHWAKRHLMPGSHVLSDGLACFRAFNFDKYARRYLGGYCFRFNRRFSMVAMTDRIANAVCCCMPCSERNLRVAEVHG